MYRRRGNRQKKKKKGLSLVCSIPIEIDTFAHSFSSSFAPNYTQKLQRTQWDLDMIHFLNHTAPPAPRHLPEILPFPIN